MKYRKWLSYLPLFLFLVLSLHLAGTVRAQGQGPVYTVNVQGIVTTMTSNYLQRALRLAEASDASVLIIQLRSEGAVLRDTRPLAVELAQADVPVVVYVTPSGTDSGAAGAFFLSASHIAAMAPDTTFGNPYPLAEVDQLLTEQTKNMVFDSVSEQLHQWNDDHGRNPNWVDRAVREGVLMTNEQAFAANPPIVDIIAEDMDELLTLLDGRVVRLENGQEKELQTLGRQVIPISPTLWEQFLLLLANPTTMFLLLVMGCIAIYAELIQPGIGAFAGLGIVFLIGSLVGLFVLPVRWLSVLGLIMSFVFIVADLFVPTHGGLTLTGVVLLIISSLTLIDTMQAPNVFIALWAILLIAAIIVAFAAVGIWLIVRLRSTPIKTGQEGMIGRLAEVRQRLSPEGLVFIEGALWRAICEHGEAEEGELVRVKAVHELRLIVERTTTSSNQPLETTPTTHD
jgi:membrane-bound serine protease (ClpP class)